MYTYMYVYTWRGDNRATIAPIVMWTEKVVESFWHETE